MVTSKYHESERMRKVQSPIIPVIGKLIGETPGTISLAQGVVYYGPPPQALEKLSTINSSVDNHKYGSVSGKTELLECISQKLCEENKIKINDGNKILVTAGANMAFLNTMFAITDPGDEIVLQRPYYFNHEMAINMLNCKAVCVPTDKNYQLNLDNIKAAITDKTRAIVSNSPNNPSGVVYPEDQLKQLNNFCKEAGIYHISDEAYEYFTFNNATHYSPASENGTEDHTISIFSLSKAYGFAAWRIGYMVIPQHLFNAIMKAQDTNLICPSIPSQYAAIGALQTGKKYCEDKMEPIRQVRELMLEELERLNTICEVPESNGAFYLFIKLKTGKNDIDVVNTLIKKYKIAVIPGYTFGMTDGCYLRISYGAPDKDTAITGIKRLVLGIKSIYK